MRTLSFSHDGKMLASASEDHFIDIAEVETGQYDKSAASETLMLLVLTIQTFNQNLIDFNKAYSDRKKIFVFQLNMVIKITLEVYSDV